MKFFSLPQLCRIIALSWTIMLPSRFLAGVATTPKFNYDVTLVGFANFADGIGRHPILFKKCLQNNVRINFLSTRDIPPAIEDAQLGLPRLDPTNKQDVGAVSILTDILADKALNIYKMVPESTIKIAYTMFESTAIPCNWAAILNKKFDMAVVPDQFLVDVYRNSGVQIPIFVLPLPLILNDFLHIQPKHQAQKIFVFGTSGGFWDRKNHMKVLEAFAAEFGNNKDFKLKLHGRFGEPEIIQSLTDKISEYNLTNVELIVQPYTWDEYIEFYKSLDCYVFLSKGEGFSITPREALAGGIPTILTNNTAHTTICNTGFVSSVQSNILVPAFYDFHYDNTTCYGSNYIYGLNYINNFLRNGDGNNADDIDLVWKSAEIGYQFDCTIQAARRAMANVYINYKRHLTRASQGRDWVREYLPENLNKKYVNLVKPTTVILGENNIIDDNFIMTNSKELYDKYQYLLGE